jgi:hypothetical protein
MVCCVPHIHGESGLPICTVTQWCVVKEIFPRPFFVLSFIGQTRQQKNMLNPTSTSSQSQSGSAKWIYIKSSSSSSRGACPVITVNPQVRSEVFGDSVAAKEPCNLISIFGAARQGKSFLMNCLSGTTNLFTISNLSTPCQSLFHFIFSLFPLILFRHSRN